MLEAFKKLHKTRKVVFNNDDRALTAARLQINEAFKKNKPVQDEKSIQELTKFAKDVECELRTTVIQIKQKPTDESVYG